MTGMFPAVLFLCLGGLASGSNEARVESLEDVVQTLRDEFEIFKRDVSSVIRKTNSELREANSQIQLLTTKMEEQDNLIRNGECAPKAKVEETTIEEAGPDIIVKPCKESSSDGCIRSSDVILIRPEHPQNVSVNFKLRNHPVDIYYLISPEYNHGEIRSLMSQTVSLWKAITSMSDNPTLGFGTFLNKPTPPFDIHNYSYHNSHSLNRDVYNFAPALHLIYDKTTSNIQDGKKSLLDAMYQAMACSDVGWRSNSRRVLVVIPGPDFNVAGDGMHLNLSITTPFDGECHLNGSGYYSEELTMDYPSEEQVLEVMAKTRTSVIFYVYPSITRKYVNLAAKLNNSRLRTYSSEKPYGSDLVTLLEQDYENMSRKVELELEQTMTSDEIRVSYFSDCNGSTMQETRICENIGDGGNVTFDVQLEVTKCPADQNEWNQTFTLRPVGLPTSLNISLQILCDD